MLSYPSLVPIATCPALLIAIALLCLFGVSSERVEAPLKILFLPCFSLIIPTFSVLFVVGLKQTMLLSSAVVYTFLSGPIARPQVYPVQWPLITCFVAPVCSFIVKISPNLVPAKIIPLCKSKDFA